MQQPDGNNDIDRCDEVLAEYFLRVDRGETVDREQFIADHSEVADALRDYFADSGVVKRAFSSSPHGSARSIDFQQATKPLGSESPASCASKLLPLPIRIGRYRVESLLGSGSFGNVYLAHDEELSRPVAIKVPHASCIVTPEDAEAFLREARLVARLDHPSIVPVYDVGRADDGSCYVVSKFIKGGDLHKKLKQTRPSHVEAAQLAASVADALHYAHRHGVVHRDVKPANILLDAADRPYVADFGLALKDDIPAKRDSYAGTPAYMSPEQARGEGHRVDGRADVYALGVVLYEMLTGHRPLPDRSQAELLEPLTREPLPPRHDDSIPAELERICLKALSDRVCDRYRTTKEMADELRHFLDDRGDAERTSRAEQLASDLHGGGSIATLPDATGSDRAVRVVPRGLRSFDAHDADFFLDLLPGPRDRSGLPESIRFWKSRIEATEPEQSFAVGLIYGPSGCGKSSLVKAGLLPWLAGSVVVIYVEAAREDTEIRLLRALHRKCPELPQDLELKESLGAIRRGIALGSDKKVLLVLDQFEQWLHANRTSGQSELVKALRQCDGERVQCILLVRDDFWLAVSRFMQQLEVPLIEGRNSVLVDLFDLAHAEKVLTAFGTAFRALPERGAELTRQQTSFLEQAVAGLARDGRVVCVQLALFAEMMKARAWTPSSLRQVGGTEGLGVAFLEETFSASTAPTPHRFHQRAAIAVLTALMPEAGQNIKGSRRSYSELREAAGYALRPNEFDELLRFLDGQVRLITPVAMPDAEGANKEGNVTQSVRSDAKYYQLTHDYVVAPLREWLARKQRETRRGRAAFRLAERAEFWAAKPVNRNLPVWWEFLEAQVFCRRRDWTGPQRKMMQTAQRYYVLRGLLLVVVLGLAGWGVYEEYRRLQAKALVQSLTTAEIGEVMPIVRELATYDRWALPMLNRLLTQLPGDSKARLHVSLALAPTDARQVDYLTQRLRNASTTELSVIVAALDSYQTSLTERFWSIVNDAEASADERLRTACALAAFAPSDPRWKEIGPFVAAKLVKENPMTLRKWVDALRPVSSVLLPALAAIIAGDSTTDATIVAACDVFSACASDRPDPFKELVDRLVATTSNGRLDSDSPTSPKQQANIAAALLRMGQYQDVRSVLRHTADPTLRSYLIHRFRWLGIDPETVFRELVREDDASVRRALLLGLGECPITHFTPSQRERVYSLVLQWYRDDPDPGIHSAAEWVLLRCWKQSERAKVILKDLMTGQLEGNRSWYVTRELYTMVVLPGPVECLIGQPPKTMRITKGFAISTKEVTVDQFLRFRKDHPYRKSVTPHRNCPIGAVSWYDAAAYCNWLSQREGIPPSEWCYEPNSSQSFAQGMKVRSERCGYRLPNAWEWEHACRAGAVTEYSWGSAMDLVSKYAWSLTDPRSRTWGVGTLKPNDCGLFDMHGNIFEWCQNRYRESSREACNESIQAGTDYADECVDDMALRDVWGGAFSQSPQLLGLANHAGIAPTNNGDILGFRVARTCD